jgi:hypothetical protein
VTERWVCKRCFADNDETNGACARCGLVRGAEATDADQAGWAAAQPSAQSRMGGGWARWLRFWWIPAIVIALAVGFFTNARRGDDGGISEAGTLHVQDLRVGDCFVFEESAEEISEVDARPCTDPHRYEIFHITPWNAGGAYPTEDAWLTFLLDACIPEFEEYVGHRFDTSVLDFVPFTPTEEGWDAGDRVVQCALVDPNETELTESLRSVAR